ncbi:hypothetical protein OB955_08070 [Halobacteria archaeon AArc-m2/3/4]|uniref:DUF7511 domain-containing protein n=1 Tax=Natronoglomus mannanivorans TaxID=2979990 RepID=A0AAP3E0Q2_9EURY|nr:hypothetical protein [Halobacteria archaeon AArc-xg1-1]MCU4972693.1 hypothetical protein [Halobacteria archaeon AArc-m2/3/4]
MSHDIDAHDHSGTDRTDELELEVEPEPEPESEVDSPSRPPLEHVTVENDDAPDECALFPCEATESELHTTWITAQEGSFVDLESMR